MHMYMHTMLSELNYTQPVVASGEVACWPKKTLNHQQQRGDIVRGVDCIVNIIVRVNDLLGQIVLGLSWCINLCGEFWDG